jgi:hypothetical protein
MKKSDENPAAVLARARWQGVGAEERSRLKKAARRAPGSGRPRSLKRCHCGRNSLSRAVARRFDCCKRAGLYPFAQ